METDRPSVAGNGSVRTRAIMLAAALVGGMIVLPACAPQRIPVDDAPAPAAPDSAGTDMQPIPLRVENRNFNDVTVWLEVQDQRTRIGTVTGSTTRGFELPARFFTVIGSVRLAAETAGARGPRTDAGDQIRVKRVTTERLLVRSGQRLVWTLESALERSHLGVY